MSNFKYITFEGCGKCKLNGACKNFKKKVNITFRKSQMADNWGRFVTVFRKGETVTGEARIKDNTVYCASAASNIYKGYEDFIMTNRVDIEVI